MEDGRNQQGKQHDYEQDLKKLQSDLISRRALMLVLHKILEWEPIHFPAIAVGIVTILFALIWYLEPSVLTLFSLLGLIFTILDFSAPLLGNYFYRMDGPNSQWSEMEEIHFERSCTRVLNFKRHIVDGFNTLSKLKHDKPNVYLLAVVGVLAIFAWIGCLMDNLLLMYLMVILFVLIPGLRKRGIPQNIMSKVSGAAKSATSKAKKN
jgi:hypothetical protein